CSRPAEDASLSTFRKRRNQVDDFHTCFKDFDMRGLLRKWRRVAMDWIMKGGIHIAFLIDGVPQYVEDSSQSGWAHRHQDRCTRRKRGNAALQAIGRIHRHRADPV